LLVKTHLEYYNEHTVNLGLNVVFFSWNGMRSACYTGHVCVTSGVGNMNFNTLRTSDADLRFYITTVQDG